MVIVVMIRRWRRLVAIILMIVPMILLMIRMFDRLDNSRAAAIEDQQGSAGQKKSGQGLGSSHRDWPRGVACALSEMQSAPPRRRNIRPHQSIPATSPPPGTCMQPIGWLRRRKDLLEVGRP